MTDRTRQRFAFQLMQVAEQQVAEQQVVVAPLFVVELWIAAV